jgi:hypothetical protein
MSEKTAIDNNDASPGETNRAPGTYKFKDENREPELDKVPKILGPTVFRDEPCPLCNCFGPHVCLGVP